MSTLFEKTQQFVKNSFERCASGKSLAHFERTVYWVKQLKPDAEEAILIAALAHDIERAFRITSTEEAYQNRELNDSAMLENHQQEGAKIMTDFLTGEKADKETIRRIAHMISYHETGGDEEADLIKDADSLSYLEINAPKHVEKLASVLGNDKVGRKIRWMFERISSEKARELAEPFYEHALDLLKD